MCSICTTSLGPDRYGPVYDGRYGFQGSAAARMPWLEKKDPFCPGCRVGAFSQGEALPPIVSDQASYGAVDVATLPAGQTVRNGLVSAPGLYISPGLCAAWLGHNGWTCARWSALTREQKLQFLRGTFLYGDYSWTTRGFDAYNQRFCEHVVGFCVPTLTGDEITLFKQRIDGGGVPNPPHTAPRPAAQAMIGSGESRISYLLQAFDAGCLGSAVTAQNLPVPSRPIAMQSLAYGQPVSSFRGKSVIGPAGQVSGARPEISYFDPSTGLGMAPAYPVVPLGLCPPGTFQTIEGTCLPQTQSMAPAVQPAGQSYVSSRQGTTWFTGMGVTWLAHRGISPQAWLNMTRAQQLSYMQLFVLGLQLVPTSPGNPSMPISATNSYDEMFLKEVRQVFTSLSPATVASRGSTVVYQNQLSQLVQLITDDCIRNLYHTVYAPIPSAPYRMVRR